MIRYRRRRRGCRAIAMRCDSIQMPRNRFKFNYFEQCEIVSRIRKVECERFFSLPPDERIARRDSEEKQL